MHWIWRSAKCSVLKMNWITKLLQLCHKIQVTNLYKKKNKFLPICTCKPTWMKCQDVLCHQVQYMMNYWTVTLKFHRLTCNLKFSDWRQYHCKWFHFNRCKLTSFEEDLVASSFAKDLLINLTNASASPSCWRQQPSSTFSSSWLRVEHDPKYSQWRPAKVEFDVNMVQLRLRQSISVF